MTEQRIPFNIRDEAMQGLADWWAERWDIWGFFHLAGYTPGNVISSGDDDTDASGPEYNGHNTITAPSTGRQVFPNTAADPTIAFASDQALAAAVALEADAARFSLVLIDKAVERAKVGATNTGNPPIRPIMVDGKPYFVVFLHPYQVTDLRIATTASPSKPVLWYDIQRARIQGGERDSNPIFDGSLGEYNGCILHESTHVPNGVDSGTGASVDSVRRAILCGAQAGVAGFGQGHDKSSYDWFEQKFDYGNKLGVKAGCISGLKKSTYNAQDFGTVVMSSRAAPH
jgi:N4-gp56 family major capsid protein